MPAAVELQIMHIRVTGTSKMNEQHQGRNEESEEQTPLDILWMHLRNPIF